MQCDQSAPCSCFQASRQWWQIVSQINPFPFKLLLIRYFYQQEKYRIDTPCGLASFLFMWETALIKINLVKNGLTAVYKPKLYFIILRKSRQQFQMATCTPFVRKRTLTCLCSDPFLHLIQFHIPCLGTGANRSWLGLPKSIHTIRKVIYRYAHRPLFPSDSRLHRVDS